MRLYYNAEFLIFEAGIYRLDRDWLYVQFEELYSIPSDCQAKNWSLDIMIVLPRRVYKI